MDAEISVIMPAYRATGLIARGVRSVLNQTWPGWRLIVMADDGEDYEALLAGHGLGDPRIRFLTTGRNGSGASAARNLALDAVDTRFVAVLDADDAFRPQKLERAMSALEHFAIVSTAIEVLDADYGTLRTVGEGTDRALGPAAHKFVNLSMDSMIAWDRSRCDARYDSALRNMNDLEFLMQLYRTAKAGFHVGTPLHEYVKVATSLSNGPAVTESMIAAKRMLLDRLQAGAYPMADPTGPAGIARFLEISLHAEAAYPAALAANPALLFEDHLEPRLAAAG